MAVEETTTKFKVDISDLKKNIQEASRQIKLANAEFKAAASGMDDWSKSADGVSKKIDSLKTVLDKQKSILSDYEKQLELIKKEYGEGSKEADNMAIKIANQQTVVNNTAKELEKYENILQDIQEEQEQAADSAEKQAGAYDNLQDSIDDQQKRLDALKDEYKQVVVEQGKNSDSAEELAKEIEDLSGELKENKEALADADKAADELDQSLEDVGDSADNASGGFTVLKGALANLVADGIRLAVDAVKDFAKETINVGKEFDSSMSEVAAISGATGEELEMLRDTAKEYGSTTVFSASESADALKYMALAGWDANQSADALGGVLNLAASSGMDLASASDMVTDYLSAFGMEAKESGYFADLLAYAQSNANTTAEDLGEAYRHVAANMNAAGQDVETTTSLLSMMANQGLKGSEAGTALAAVLRDMTAKMKDGAIQIGETSVQVMDSNGNFRDMTDILLDVEKATQGMGDAEKATALQTTFTADSIKGLNLILNAGVEEAASFEEELRNSSGTAKTMADIMNDNLGGDLTALNSKLEGVQIALYEKFEPALRKGIDALSGLLDALSWVVDHSDEIVGAITAIATGVGAYVAYTTAMKVMEEGWKALTIVTKAQAAAQAALNFVMNLNPIGLIIAAIAALVAAFVYLWNHSEKFRDFWVNLWEVIKGAVSGIVDWFKGIFDGIVGFFKENWQSILTFLINPFAGLFKYAYENFEGFRNFVDGIKNAILNFFLEAGEKIKEAWNSVVEFFSGLWEGVKGILSAFLTWYYETFIQPMIEFFQPVVQFFQEAWQIIKELAEGCWLAIQAVWQVVKDWFNENVVQPVVQFFTDLWNKIKEKASEAWENIKSIWAKVSSWFNTTVVQPVVNFFTDLWDKVSSFASDAWDKIKGVWSTVKEWFNTNIVKPVSEFFGNMWDKVKEGASAAWDGITGVFGSVADWFKEKFSDAWQKVKDVFSTGGKVFDGIKEGITDAFKTVVNAIIRGINKVIAIPFNAINKMLDKIRDISIAGIQPFSGLISRLTVPEIPELASGGVLAKGQVGLLEGDGAEAVVPLENNKKWIKAVTNDLKKSLMNDGILSSAGQSVTNYNFVQNNTSPKALSRLEIYRQTKNQLNFAKGV